MIFQTRERTRHEFVYFSVLGDWRSGTSIFLNHIRCQHGHTVLLVGASEGY